MQAVTYYADRSARDPAWRREQIEEAREREQARRAADPDGFRARRREATRRTRTRQAEAGLTFHELLERSREHGVVAAGPGDRAVLAWVLRDELRRGRIDYHGSSRRYVLNGGLPEDVKAAMRDLGR
jgi:hypothetical protein